MHAPPSVQYDPGGQLKAAHWFPHDDAGVGVKAGGILVHADAANNTTLIDSRRIVIFQRMSANIIIRAHPPSTGALAGWLASRLCSPTRVADATERAETVISAPSPLLVTRDMQPGYDGQAILPPIDIRVGRREFWAVLGPNGAGKSTFVRTLLGLDRPVRGTVTRAADLRPCYVPQQATLDPIFPVRVLEFVLMGVLERGRLLGRAPRADVEAAETALTEVRAAELRHRLLRDLSGGQRQRVLMARALAARANLYVLDEPTAALDVASEREILELVGTLAERRGATVVMITHMLEDGLRRADQVLLLDRDHDVAIAATPAEIIKTPALQRLYGPVTGQHQRP